MLHCNQGAIKYELSSNASRENSVTYANTFRAILVNVNSLLHIKTWGVIYRV